MVRLEDARGFWMLYPRDALVWLANDCCRPRGDVWLSMTFHRAPAVDGHDRYRSPKCAIGPDNGSASDLYRPFNWQQPAAAQKAS